MLKIDKYDKNIMQKNEKKKDHLLSQSVKNDHLLQILF